MKKLVFCGLLMAGLVAQAVEYRVDLLTTNRWRIYNNSTNGLATNATYLMLVSATASTNNSVIHGPWVPYYGNGLALQASLEPKIGTSTNFWDFTFEFAIATNVSYTPFNVRSTNFYFTSRSIGITNTIIDVGFADDWLSNVIESPVILNTNDYNGAMVMFDQDSNESTTEILVGVIPRRTYYMVVLATNNFALTAVRPSSSQFGSESFFQWFTNSSIIAITNSFYVTLNTSNTHATPFFPIADSSMQNAGYFRLVNLGLGHTFASVTNQTLLTNIWCGQLNK